MKNSDLYLQSKKREKKFWLALFLLIFVMLIHGTGYLVNSFSYKKLSKREPLLMAYTPSGIPAFVEAYTSEYHTRMEVETFLKAALEGIFSFKYSDYLLTDFSDKVSQYKILLSKVDKVYKDKGVFHFFDPRYYTDFIQGLVESQFIFKIVRAKVVIFTNLLLPIDLQIDEKKHIFIARVNLQREELTGEGRRVKKITYTIYARWGPRTTRNPWGFYIYKII